MEKSNGISGIIGENFKISVMERKLSATEDMISAYQTGNLD